MTFQKPSFNYAAAWTGVFFCTVLAQIALLDKQPIKQGLSNSQITLLKNAVIPIYLSENRSASTRQLENLIQETDIRQIHVYTSDQELVTQVLNASVPSEFRETQIENMPMVFQGSMAGSVQLDIAYKKAESKVVEHGLIITLKASLITFIAWLFTFLYLSISKWLLPKLHAKTRQPGVLDDTPRQNESGSSLLIYIHLLPEKDLSQNAKACRECLTRFSRKLESHLRIYGGRILSISEERLVCRMAAGQSQNDLQQALTFCWGIARPMIYRHEGRQFQLAIKSLLHKTEIAAKPGDLYRALTEIDKSIETAVVSSLQGAHITEQLLSALDSESNFDHIKSREHPELHQILSVKKSMDILWQKQESMVSSTNPEF